MNQIAAAIESNAVTAVAGNDVARSSHCASDEGVVGAQEIDSRAEAKTHRPGSVRADVVALNLIAGDGVVEQLNVVTGVAGNDVARGGSCAADGVIGGTCATAVVTDGYADNTLAYAATHQGGGARGVRADVVALNRRPARSGAVNLNASVVARDDVARGRRCASDDVVRRALNAHAEVAVGGRRCAGRIQAEETTLD